MRATKLTNLPVMAMREGMAQGEVIDIVVDPEKKKASHYIVRKGSRYDLFLVTASDVHGIGTGYLLVPDGDALRRIFGDAVRMEVVTRGFYLMDAQVISDAGVALGGIVDYEFDPTTGALTDLILENGSQYPATQIIGLSGTTVFVKGKASRAAAQKHVPDRPRKLDTAGVVMVEQEAGEQATAAAANSASSGVRPPSPLPSKARSAYRLESAVPKTVPNKETPAENQMVRSPDVMRRLLVGKRLADEVTSDDGIFSLPEGTVITEWHMQLAEQHDAVQLLMKHVEPG